MLARSLDRSGPDGGRIGPGAGPGPAEKVGIDDVEDDGPEPLGTVDEEFVLLKFGRGFFGSAGPVEVDAIVVPDPEAGSGVGFELEFFLSDSNICSTYLTAFSISSLFDKSIVSCLPLAMQRGCGGDGKKKKQHDSLCFFAISRHC